MIQDMLLAALGAHRAASRLLESELKKLEESGVIPAAEIEAASKAAREALEERAKKAQERMGPILETARESLGSVVTRFLGVPTRAELDALTQRLERAIAALEKEQKAREPRPEPQQG